MNIMQRLIELWLTLLCILPSMLVAAEQEEPAKEAPPEVSIFPDKKLEAAVRHYVFEKRNTDKPVTETDVANISVIKARHAGITNLAGLEKCRNLASLDLAGNDVSDLSPIAGLPRLQFLDVSGNRIEDLASLTQNTALQYIEMSGNRVKEVGPLSGLTNLASLYLGGNRIVDIQPLMGLPRIASLYLEDNQIASIDGVGGLRTLWTLSLSKNRIADIRPLHGLNGLYHLFLEDNRISDLAVLVGMGKEDTEKRFIPFINIYVKGNPLNEGARGWQWEELKGMGARLHN